MTFKGSIVAFLLFCSVSAQLLPGTIVSINGKAPSPIAPGINCDGVVAVPNVGSRTCRRPTFGGNTVFVPTASSIGFLEADRTVTVTFITGPAQFEYCLGTFVGDTGNVQTSFSTDCSCIDGAPATSPIAQPDPNNPALSFVTLDNLEQDLAGVPLNTMDDEISILPRPFCYRPLLVLQQPNENFFSGLFIEPAFNCDTDVDCAIRDVNILAPITEAERAIFAGRTRCCKSTLGAGVGVCINPFIDSCCGGAPFNNAQERCCSASAETIAPIVAPGQVLPGAVASLASCPCTRARLPAAVLGNTGHPDCPGEEAFCCLKEKFSTLLQNPFFQLNGIIDFQLENGMCYNPNLRKCCNTGSVYDPAIDQCCVINGIQTVNQPCPCQSDAHCTGSQILPNAAVDQPRNLTCCVQTAPVPLEDDFCSVFANFPSGQSDTPFRVDRCTGVCIDPRYQICCNGVSCIRQYERCCNNTCCNRFVGTCATGFRPGAPGNADNFLEFRVEYNYCTTIEQLNVLNSFRIFVLPAALLLMALMSAAVVLVFANLASARRFIFLEKAVILFAILVILMVCPVFFSPAWKYGLVIVLVALLAICSAAARSEFLNILTVVLLFITLIYVMDPFHGNDYLNLAYLRQNNGEPDMESAGLLYTIHKSWENITSVLEEKWCSHYYSYFIYDTNLRDTQRVDNPWDTTFGYCSRGWIIALLIVEGFMMALLFVLFILALLAWILRFRKIPYEPVELELREAGDDVIIG